MAGYNGGGFPGQGNPVPQAENRPDLSFEMRMKELERDLSLHEERATPPTSTGAPSYASQSTQGYPGGGMPPPQNIYSQGGGGQYPFQQQQVYNSMGGFPPQTPTLARAGDEMNQLKNKMTNMKVGGNMAGHPHTMNYQQVPLSSNEFQPGPPQAKPEEAYPPLGSLPPRGGGHLGNHLNSGGMPISAAPGGVFAGHDYRLGVSGTQTRPDFGYEYAPRGHPPQQSNYGPRPSYAQTTSPAPMYPVAPRVGAAHMQPNLGGGQDQYRFPSQVGVQHFPPPHGQNTTQIPPQGQYDQYYNPHMHPGAGAQGFVPDPYPQQPPPKEGKEIVDSPANPGSKKTKGSKKVSERDSESESEEEDKRHKSGKKTTSRGKGSKPRRDSSSDGESRGKLGKRLDKVRGNERRSTKVNRTKSKRKPKTFDVVQEPEELPKGFGTYRALDRHDRKYRTIATYITNGSPSKDDGFKVRIHQILEFGDSHSVGKAPPASKSNTNKMLLWWKTTPGSARKLAQQQDGCIAFYDVITRAYAAPPSELEGPVRQTVLLCSVSLGRMFNSPNGFQYWVDKDFPQGNDSVKGTGRFTPDPKDHRDDQSATIPSGKVVEHGKFKKYELEYSEYLIFDAKRAKVRYAVDVELIPPRKSEDDDSDSQEYD